MVGIKPTLRTAGDDRNVIVCLRLAAERLLALDPHRSDESELRSTILRIDAMLLRPLSAISE